MSRTLISRLVQQCFSIIVVFLLTFFPYGQYMFTGLSFGPVDTPTAHAAGDGTAGDPFTDLYSAYAASQQAGFTAGTYNFDIDGNTFSSYVDANGYVVVASADNTETNDVSGYTEVTAMTLNSDDILNRTILAAVNPDELRITSTGVTTADRISTDPLYIARLNSFQTLSAVNGATWTGSGGVLTDGAGADRDLNEVIWHSSGSGGSLHWFPDGNPGGAGQADGFGSTLNTSEPTLWMRDTSPSVAPGGVTNNLNLWLKADKDIPETAGTISSWPDQTGNNTFTAVTGDPQIGQQTYNFNPVVTFSGNDRIDGSTSIITAESYIVGEFDDVGNAASGIFFGKTTGNNVYHFLQNDPSTLWLYSGATAFNTTPPTTDVPHVFIGNSDGANRLMRFDGENQTLSNANLLTSISGVPRLGNRANLVSPSLRGAMAEIVSLSSTPTPLERQQIESYLALKYGITLDAGVGTYKDSAGGDVYDLTADTSYQSNIVGIARDDASSLDQRISKSVNTGAVLTITTDDAAADFTSANGGSRTQLADGEYVVLGSDNGAITSAATTIPGYLNKIARQWRAEVTNYTGDINVEFDTAAITGTDWDLVQSDTSDFSAGGANLTKVADLDTNGEALDVTLVDGKYYGLLEEGSLVAPGGVVSDLALWLKADGDVYNTGIIQAADGQAVETWTDLSGRGNDVTEATNRPDFLNNVTDNINFNPVVDFDGVNERLTTTAVNILAAKPGIDAYVVADWNTAQDNFSRILSEENAGAGNRVFMMGHVEGPDRLRTLVDGNTNGSARFDLFEPTTSFGSPNVYQSNFDGSVSTLSMIVNGNEVIDQTIAAGTVTRNPISRPLSIGAASHSPTSAADAKIAEVVIYDAANNTGTNRQQIQSYLALKYGITLDTSVEDYLDSNGTSVFENGSFNQFAEVLGGTQNPAGANPAVIDASTTYIPDVTGPHTFIYGADVVSGTAGASIGTTAGGTDVYTPTTPERLTPTNLQNTVTVTLTAGTTYHIITWSGGSSSAQNMQFSIGGPWHDVFGIGRDDASGLDQRVSKSINDDAIVTITTNDGSADFTSANDNSRTAHTANLDFQVIANNNGAAAWTATGAPTNYQISERQWQIQENGTGGAINIAFDVADAEFDMPALLGGTVYYLVHDADDDFDLSDETPVALTNSSGDLWSTNINLADNAIFALATIDTPVDIAGVSGGLTLWLDADDSSTLYQDNGCSAAATSTDTVGCWQDKSGAGNDVTTTNATREPTVVGAALNSKTVLDFAADSLVTATGNQITSNTSYTKFAVFRYDTATPYNNIISASSNTGGGHAFFGGVGRSNLALFHGGTFNEVVGQPGTGKYTVGTGRYGAPDSLTNVTNVNGIESAVSTATRNFNGTHTTEIGSVFGGGHGLDGHLAEAIVFDRALTDAEIDEVECYLATKWDIPISNDSPNCVVTLATVEFSAAAGASTDETTNDNFVELLVSGTTTAAATVDVSIIGGTASAGTDYTFTDPTTVTIPVGTYDGTSATAITIPVPTLPGDLVAEGDETIVFNLTNPTGEAVLGDANGDSTDAQTFSYTVTDDDAAAINVVTTNNLTSETGPGAAVVTFTLASQPTHDVVITLDIVGAADQDEAKLNFIGAPAFTSTVTIAPADWNTPQLALIFGLDDLIDDGNQNVTVVTSGSVSTDPNYNIAGTAIADAVIVNQDDDISDIVVSTNDNETSEDGDTATITLTPSSAPTEEVLVPVTITDLTEGSVVESSVVFASGTVASVDVIITGVDDTELDIDMPYQVIFGDPISVDVAYDALTAADVANQNLINLDNDDTDNDGNPDSIEDSGNNSGDGNGDGIPDSQQSEVSGTPNPLTGDYTTIEASGGCAFITENAAIAEGSLAAQDPSYEYPVGLVDFQVQCATPGASSTVTIYYGQEYDTSNWKWRKFDSNGNEYSDISSLVTYATSTLGTDVVTTATFTVTDGDPATDEDGIADGFINDPSGPAVAVSTSTGTTRSSSRRSYSCHDPAANNYDTSDTHRDSECEYDAHCHDTTATNYNPAGEHQQSTCEYDGVTPPTTPVDPTDPVTGLPITTSTDSTVALATTNPNDSAITESGESVCSPYMTGHIKFNGDNNPDEVNKLITFLNDKQGESLAIDGTYDTDDFEAVKRFQQKYSSEVLQIWGLSEPTGYVYKTTLLKINSFYCTGTIQCPYFTEFNNLNENSTSSEVQRTKILMKDLGFYTGPVNATYDLQFKNSMAAFQETFRQTMLDPWGLKQGTGYKYKTTNKFLNMLVGCDTGAVDLDGRGMFDY